MLGLTFSTNLNWGSYITSIAKTVSRKIGDLIHSVKFFSLEVALYLYKSTIRSCIEYCCHIWASAPNCYLELLNQKNGYVELLILYLLSLLSPWLIVEIQQDCLFYRYYFGRRPSKLTQLVPIHEGGLLVILIDCMIFPSPFLDVKRMSMSTVSSLTQLDSRILCLQNVFL